MMIEEVADEQLGLSAGCLEEVPEDAFGSVAAAGSGAYKTIGCCWCLPWYSSFTRCGLICPGQTC